MAIFIKDEPRLKDHFERIKLFKLDYSDGSQSLTFQMDCGNGLVTYKRLKEIYDLIGKTLENESDYKNYLKMLEKLGDE